MEINKKQDREFRIKKKISYLEIIILITSIFAFSYLVYSSSIKIVSAEDPLENYVCCEKTLEGSYCQYIPEEQCDSNFQKSPTQCKNTEFCKLGCCIDSEIGFCNKRTPNSLCKEGTWFNDESCAITQCERGCCVLGNNAHWTNEENCNIESGFLGTPVDFRTNINSEAECILLTENENQGACVFESNGEDTCIFTTKKDCIIRTGDASSFYENTFCSDSQLNTNCISQDYTNCLDGKQEIYWFDSCNNPEEAYKECNVFFGTICGQYRPGIDTPPTQGDYVCRDLSCIDSKGNHRKNGESWCEYEGTIGQGKDIVGSRQIRHICYYGEEIIEACDDYRNQICIQNTQEFGNGETFTEAGCRVNRWRECFEYNTEDEKMAEKCEENSDCFIKSTNIDDDFKFDFCVPQYPGGNTQTCDFGSVNCTYLEQKKIVNWELKWVCEKNCDCKNKEFTEKMNDLCTALGDCGAYVNIAGEISDDGYSIRNAPKLDSNYLNNLKKYANDNPNQKPAEPGNFTSILGGLGIPENLGQAGGLNNRSDLIANIGLGVGAVGLLASALGTIGWSAGSSISILKVITGVLPTTATGTFAGIAAFGNAVLTLGAAVAVAGIFIAIFGLQGQAADIMLIGELLTGATLGALEFFGAISWGLAANFLIAIAVAVLLWAFCEIFGIGDTREKTVQFKCLAWQAPSGGENCGLCNNNLMNPCTEYRCQSLGQTCEFINKGTSNEICVNIPLADISPPKISPWFEEISEGHKYIDTNNDNFGKGFSVRTSNGNCIEEYTRVKFGIKTDKPSQCKIMNDLIQQYDDSSVYFGDNNLYLTNHNLEILMPNINSFANQYNLTEEQIQDLGKIEYFVKCKSAGGAENLIPYIIQSCVNPGADLTPPRITKTIPLTNSFIKYNQTEQNLTIYSYEPANCSWSFDDKIYSEMENNMLCQNDLIDATLYGWSCKTILTDLRNQNTFYIRCEDQPWLGENNDSRNSMQQSFIYKLSPSSSELIIKNILPQNNSEITSGVEPMTLTLRLETDGGAENGKAICNWKGNGYMDQFTETNSNFHSYKATNVIAGNYKLNFTCKDIAGNLAEASTSFKVKIDNQGPKIIRAYYNAENNNLEIKTNEAAECKYSFNEDFVYEDSNLMQNQDNKYTHFTKWKLKTYYIQCQDNFENKGGKIIIKAYTLI